MENKKHYYKLNLTLGERKAISWIGNSYSTGDDFRKVLLHCDVENPITVNGVWDWDDKVDYMFLVPEHLAWKIKELFEEEENRFPCFSPGFKEKLMAFADSII